MALGYAKLVWQQTPGPKLTIVVMSLVAGLANGGLLAVINSAIAARVEGTLAGQHLVLFFGALAVYLVGSYFAMYRATELSGQLMHRLRSRMVEELARSSVQSVERYGRGDIFAHFSEDISVIGDTALKLVSMINGVVLTIFCLGYLAVLSPMILVLTLILSVIGICGYFWQQGVAKRLLASARQDEADYYESVGDVLGGFKELRLNSAVARDVTRHMNRTSDRFRLGFAKAEFIFFSGSMTSKVLLFVVLGVVALVPESWLQATGVSAFQILAVLLFTFAPLESIVDFIGPYLRAQVACDKLAAFSAAMTEGRESAEDSAAGLRLDGSVTLERVSMHYTDPELGETFRLGPIDLTVEPGEIVFLVGGNGSGKSTLLKVLAGLYPVQSGRLTVNGSLIDATRLNAYRGLISAVFQDFHIFPRLYGLDPMPRAHIEADLARIGLAAKVELLADCFSTTRLSGGERKRLALVVALAADRPLLLLDEFGAEQDPEFRAFFYREFLPSLRKLGLTIVAATHDDAFFDCCDRVVRMDHGRIKSIESTAASSARASVRNALS